jgi:dihydroorotase
LGVDRWSEEPTLKLQTPSTFNSSLSTFNSHLFSRYLPNLQKMSVLIKQARIICQGSALNGQIKDIFVENGIIQSIGDNITTGSSYVINEEKVCVSIGWMDIFAQFGDPGFEYRETIESGAAAAAAGGFTDVLVMPNCSPVVHNKSMVGYILQKAATLPVTIHPAGAITKNNEGKELAEMYDMRQAGAAAFTDGSRSIQSPGLLLKALQYVKAFEGTIIQLPDDKTIGTNGLMNEGITSTQLGLPGKPSIAEELMVARDIELLRYTGSKLHITGISTQKTVELIAAAKKEGLNITCSATPYHIYFCEEDLVTYDTNLKVNPPLRTRADMMALRKAYSEGLVDCMASHHQPEHSDAKDCEFEYAAPGMIGLQTAFASAITAGISVENFVAMQTTAARTVFGLPLPELKEGAAACITIFNPEALSSFSKENNQSLSANSPFFNQPLKGRIAGIINGRNEIIYA